MSFVYRGMGQSERASMSPALRTKGQCTQISGCTVKTKSEGTTATFENTLLGVSAESDDAAATYYVRDPRGGLLSERTPSGTYYYGFDGRGSVTDIIDSGGGDDAQYVYDPFGQITAMAQGLSVGTDNPWRYVGAYQDGTGLYHMGERYYDPNTGRFTQQDPVTNPLDPKQWNRYTYTGGDPVNFRDPTGMRSCKHGGGGLGGALHTVYSVVLIAGGGFIEVVGDALAAATCPETLGAGCLVGAGLFFGGHYVVDQGIEASRGCE
jgi:RHS repeat-associated protein